MRYRITNKLALDAAFADIAAVLGKTGYVEISANGHKRSPDQNALYWTWCREVADSRADGTSEYDVDGEIKLLHGFKLRREADAEFDELLTRTIDKLWPEAGRWDLAHDLSKEMSCTSHLDAAHFSRLLDWMQLHYWGSEQVRLERR